MATVKDLSGNTPYTDKHVGGPDDAGPAIRTEVVTPSDTQDLPYGTARGLHIGDTGGAVAIIDGQGNTVTYAGLPVDYQLNVRVRRVLSSGTVATPIRALY